MMLACTLSVARETERLAGTLFGRALRREARVGLRVVGVLGPGVDVPVGL
jgi:hypothetical protein